jgi:hypothetical protein
MTDGYVVVAAALEADAATFGRWKAKLQTIKAAVPAEFNPDAFSYIPGAQDVYTKYTSAARALRDYIAEGSVVFAGFERTLLKTVVMYAEAEKLSSADIAKVQAELASL